MRPFDVKGIRAHRVKPLHPHDRTRRDGILVTSVPRTLLDIAGVAEERVLRRAVNQAARTGWFNRREMEALMSRNLRRKCSKQLRAVIASVNPGTRRTRSDLEAAFVALCRTYGLPEPVVNGTVMGIEVENDRRRDAQLKRAGYEVLRIPNTWLDSDPRGVAETVTALLACPG